MKRLCWTGAAAVAGATLLGALSPRGAAQPAKPAPVDAAKWNAVVGKAIDFLKSTQDANGGWSTDKSPGVTGVVLTGLLHTGKVSLKDPAAERALKYIESLVNPKAKHIAGKDPKVQLQNYVTSINVMALSAASRPGPPVSSSFGSKTT